jgi:hypothetical protein
MKYAYVLTVHDEIDTLIYIVDDEESAARQLKGLADEYGVFDEDGFTLVQYIEAFDAKHTTVTFREAQDTRI